MIAEKKVLFVVLSAHGHINPTLAIAADLVKRGARVTYPIAEQFAPMLRSIGANVILLRHSTIWEGFSGREDRDNRAVQLDRASYVDEVWKLCEAVRADPPDLLLYDFLSIEGAILAKRMPGVPAIRLFPTFAHNKCFEFSMERFGCSAKQMREGIDDTFPAEGVGQYIVDDVSNRNLVFVPRFFQCMEETFDERFSFVGPSIARRRFYGEWRPSAIDGPVILVSLGTVMNAQIGFFRMCIEALGGQGFHVVISVGNSIDVGLLGWRPPGVEVHNFVSHVDVLPHASAFIGHGGMNSTMESLYFGVPPILVPQDDHQCLIAERVTDLSLGRMLSSSDFTVESLRGTLTEVLSDDSLRARVKNVGLEMRKSDAVDRAVELAQRCMWRP